MVRTLVRRSRRLGGTTGGGGEEQRGSPGRNLRRSGVAAAIAGVLAAGCSGPTVPLSVGLADRPVDLLLGQRAEIVGGAAVPPAAIPPSMLPDFDMPFAPMPFDPGGFLTPTTSPFPSWGTTTTTLPAGCTATPPTRSFDDSPDNIEVPPLATRRGDDGYVARTAGEITVDDDTVAGTLLPTLTRRKVDNVQILARFPIGEKYQYQNNKPADGAPSDFTFDVLVDVGKAENNTRTTYRVQPAYQKIVYQDYSQLVTSADGRVFQKYAADGVVDDFFTDQDKNGSVDWNPDPLTHQNDYGYVDTNENGSIDWNPDPATHVSESGWIDLPGADGYDGELQYESLEYFFDTNGNGVFDNPEEFHVDMDGGGVKTEVVDGKKVVPDGHVDNNGWNSRGNALYKFVPDGVGDSPSITRFGGGMYISSMLTGTKEANRVTFSRERNNDGIIIDAPGARLATLPLVESNTVNTEAYTDDGRRSIAFESTVFGRVDVDVCRTDMVAWKVALDRGFIADPQSAVDFSAEYSIATQHGGLFLEEKSVVKSIQAGSPTVKRTIESVYTTEPAPGTDPNPPS